MEQGLGKYCDSNFIRYTSREMQEALNMTSEEMDIAAHQLMIQNRANSGQSPLNHNNINITSPQYQIQYQSKNAFPHRKENE